MRGELKLLPGSLFTDRAPVLLILLDRKSETLEQYHRMPNIAYTVKPV